MNEYFKKYTGGLALMLSVLFLLIGFTKYDQILMSIDNDTTKSIEFVKTSISGNKKNLPKKESTFSLENDGEIMKVVDFEGGTLTYHYRALLIPELQENYTALPKLKTEIIIGDSKELHETDIYKLDRKKGVVYFLLKVEKNHQVAMTAIYTGNYKVELIN